MFRVGITPQPLFFFPWVFAWFLSVFIIINTSSWKRGCSGGDPTLKIFIIFVNRKTSDYQKRRETETKFPGDSLF